MSRILEYFSEYIDKYNQFEKVLSNIKRYEYSDDEKYSIMPLYFQRGFKAKGRDTDKGKAIFSYGFDSYDKLIYIKNGKLESFILYFDESINLFCFEGNNPYSNEKTLSYIQITELISKDQLYGTVKVNRRQEIKVEKYYYENGRMIKIENPIDFEYGTYNDILNIQYDNQGNVTQVIDEESWLANGVVYKKVNRDEAEELKKGIIEKICKNIIRDMVDKYSRKGDEICYISLEIHEEPHTVLSSLYARLAFESERSEYVLKKGRQYEKYIGEYSNNPIEIYDKNLEMECNILIQYYIEYSDCYKESDNIVREIINTLRNFEWSKHIAISKYFEVLEPAKYD